ncbi:MAG: Zn-ribbon domain-containing OB-fold protein [Dehalococcoidia bacterium]
MQTATEKLEGLDVWIYHGQIYIPNRYSAGAVGSRFLIELRDRKRIMGTRCSGCNRVYVPARSICGDCYQQLEDWVEVSDKGTVLTYSVCHEDNGVQPVEAPVVYGIVQLDGADTGFVHMMGEVELEELRIGMRVKAVFREDRMASILDIKYFKPL